LCGSSVSESNSPEPGQQPVAALGDAEEAAVRAVGVRPQPARAADAQDLRQRIDRPRVGRARVRHDEERSQARGLVLFDLLLERVDPHPPAGIDGNDPQRALGKARHLRRLGDAGMRVLGVVERPILELLAQLLRARGDQRGQVRQRAAAGEDAVRAPAACP
jgi:hypothetical protein